jgi:hypothetical protein
MFMSPTVKIINYLFEMRYLLSNATKNYKNLMNFPSLRSFVYFDPGLRGLSFGWSMAMVVTNVRLCNLFRIVRSPFRHFWGS